MADPYFRRLSGDDSAGSYLASGHTVGPWSAQAQHGGPPNALAVLLASRVLRARSGREDLHALRIASDFVGAVPTGEIDVAVTLGRVARSAAVCGVELSAAGRVCLTSRIWFVRDGNTAGVASSPVPAGDPPASARDSDVGGLWDFGYARSIVWAFETGAPPQLGPARVWARPRHPVLDETAGQLPGLARAVLVADSASGVSAELDWSAWSFANVDLDVHLARPFIGEWVHLAAATTVGAQGSALARSTISDAEGEVGSGLQTLVVARLPSGAH